MKTEWYWKVVHRYYREIDACCELGRNIKQTDFGSYVADVEDYPEVMLDDILEYARARGITSSVGDTGSHILFMDTDESVTRRLTLRIAKTAIVPTLMVLAFYLYHWYNPERPIMSVLGTIIWVGLAYVLCLFVYNGYLGNKYYGRFQKLKNKTKNK